MKILLLIIILFILVACSNGVESEQEPSSNDYPIVYVLHKQAGQNSGVPFWRMTLKMCHNADSCITRVISVNRASYVKYDVGDVLYGAWLY